MNYENAMKTSIAGRSLILLMALMLGVGVLLSCGGSKKKKGGLNTPIQFILKCESGKAIREHRKRKEDKLVERGPVALRKKLSCSDARDYAEGMIRKFKRTGIWEEFYTSSGKVLSRGEYKKNKRVGTFRYYNPSGQNTKIVDYIKGKKEGREITYFPGSTDIRISGQNKAGKKIGEWVKKSNRAGDCITRGYYKKGYKTGPWQECGTKTTSAKRAGSVVFKKTYYVKFKGTYRDGARTGVGAAYYSNGQVLAKGNYIVDAKCLKKEIYQSGREKNCGKRTGPWALFFPDGNKAARGSYSPRTGLRTGYWVEYYRSGQKLSAGVRRHARSGTWTFWDKKGAIIGKFTFKRSDVFIRTGTVYKNGRKFAEALPGKRCRKKRNMRGKMILRCREAPGAFLSALAKYDAKNDRMIFRFTMKNGRWRFYDASGAPRAEGACQSGRRFGSWRVREGGSWKTKNYGLMRSPRC